MMGLEYHSDSVLKDIKKHQTVEQARKAMELLKKHKLMVMATLLIGHWNETEEDRKEFFKFFGKYVDHFGLNLITPLPGTPLFYQMRNWEGLKIGIIEIMITSMRSCRQKRWMTWSS